jgi:predicted cobalt transporter CbtA
LLNDKNKKLRENGKMKALTFIIITLISGAIAGTILGLINQVIVEPYIDKAVNIEVQNSIKEEGEAIDPNELVKYRIWQKGGEIVAGTILGISIAALFGIVFAYSRSSLPGSNNKKKALVLAGMMWFVLFLVPALKYPANPPAVGDPETIYYRQSLYVVLLIISGFSALVLAFLYTKKIGDKSLSLSKRIAIPLIYAAIIIGTFLILPPNPDKITTVPMDLVFGFRIASGFAISVFWGLLALIFGSFWDRLKPHETTRIRTI